MQEEDAMNNYVDELRRVTSSENNALILEKLFYDECSTLEISSHENYHDDFNKFVVREGDDMHSLGYYIGKSIRLESLSLCHMPLNNFFFRDGLALNKSIQELNIWEDLGEDGFRCLAPFFRDNNSLKKLSFDELFISTASMKIIASLLSQCQIKSLKRINLSEIEFSDSGYTEFARALNTQPQLEVLSLSWLYEAEDNNNSFLGHIALGATMKNWKSPCLKKLEMESSNINGDDGMIALAEGMANCSNLEFLDFRGNDTITETGLRALSSLFQSKDLLQSVDLSNMSITDIDMTALAPGLASLKSLKRLNLSMNNIGDVGLEALATAQPHFRHLEDLKLSNNAGFSVVGSKALSSVLQTASRLKCLNLSRNSIDDEGLHAFTMAMKDQCTIDSLYLRNNAISSGVRSLAEMTTLRRLYLQDNNIGDYNIAMEALVEAMENLRNLEYLQLTKVTSSGLSIMAPFLQSDRCHLQEFDLCETDIENSGAIALAKGLRGNESLTKVFFDHRSLTDVGWSEFVRLLCDTSSVSKTYYSNHTLEEIGDSYWGGYPASMTSLLDLNKQKDQGVNVPICKILMSHSDIDMTPLLQWKLKLLPFVVTWFERAQSSQPSQSWIEFTGRKLSAMYQFIGGTSHSVVEGYAYSNKRTSDLSSRKRKINQCDE